MNTGMKVLNVFGILLAWLLSIVLVALLFVAPMFLSAVSVVTPENLRQTVEQISLPELITAIAEDALEGEEKQILEIVSTDAVQEIYASYVSGVFDVLEGKVPEETLSVEKIQETVFANFDEIYEAVKAVSPELAEHSEEEAKAMVEGVLQELTAQLPAPETLIQDLVGQQPEIEPALEMWKQIGKVKPAFIGVLVALCVLIFICRLFGFRGFRWLSVDLFVAAGLSGVICVALTLAKSMLEMAAAEIMVVGLFAGNMLSDLLTGVYIRTGAMLLSAIVLLVVYLLIRKNHGKKQEGQPYTQERAQENIYS